MRFLIEGDTINLIRKVYDEVDMIRFIIENVSIVIPKVIGSGLAQISTKLRLFPFLAKYYFRTRQRQNPKVSIITL